MKSLEIAKNIYWLGAVDWNIRDFHGYSIYQGTTYNAFLIRDEKVVLIDTVKKEFFSEWMDQIREVIDPKKIDWVISNHSELDHSGSLERLMHVIGDDKPIYCSKMGAQNLARHFPGGLNLKPVNEGEEMKLGQRTLTFLETRMLHWPDSMFTYLKEDQILFSNDAFGEHYAGMERFDDQIGEAIMPHAKKYFANILLPYAPLVLKLVEKVTRMGLKIRMICPDHGIMWRKDPGKIIQAYVEWAQQKPKKKALVIYDTMWHSTQAMAEAMVEALAQEGVDARTMHLRATHRSDVMAEVLDAGAILLGSPTLNNGLFPTVADFLCYLKGLKPQNKIAAAFGSYGWSGEAVKLINQELEEMKFQIVDPGLKIQYVPDKKGLEACQALGKKVAQAFAL
ncbi:MAG: FprA family A-type flavoprotein [Deltaproteobacteria bacterium]|nr:FprA family A-type flavoprotein [Deltaproteobacteria bacterium]